VVSKESLTARQDQSLKSIGAAPVRDQMSIKIKNGIIRGRYNEEGQPEYETLQPGKRVVIQEPRYQHLDATPRAINEAELDEFSLQRSLVSMEEEQPTPKRTKALLKYSL
jgi:hypothetical protein